MSVERWSVALDTRNKRCSAMAVRLPFLIGLGLPLADGTIAQGDRQHTVQMYSGILAGAAVEVLITDIKVSILLRRGRR